jgi:hypothetical protein
MSIPAITVALAPEQEVSKYLKLLKDLPRDLKKMVTSGTTGAYILGLVKTFDVPVEKAPEVALLVLQIAIGEKTLQGLSDELQQKFGLPEGEAQAMAKDIETELFRPVLAELGKKEPRTSENIAARQEEQEDDLGLGMPNTLDLRKNKSEQ